MCEGKKGYQKQEELIGKLEAAYLSRSKNATAT